jgi:hypothetical protein
VLGANEDIDAFTMDGATITRGGALVLLLLNSAFFLLAFGVHTGRQGTRAAAAVRSDGDGKKVRGIYITNARQDHIPMRGKLIN